MKNIEKDSLSPIKNKKIETLNIGFRFEAADHRAQWPETVFCVKHGYNEMKMTSSIHTGKLTLISSLFSLVSRFRLRLSSSSGLTDLRRS